MLGVEFANAVLTYFNIYITFCDLANPKGAVAISLKEVGPFAGLVGEGGCNWG